MKSISTRPQIRIRLGIVVPTASESVFQDALVHLQGVDARWVRYQDEDEIRSAVREVLPEVDALFFAGPMPLDRCRDLLPEELPVAVARQGPIDLALALLRAREQGLALAPASVDTFDEQVVEELAGELGLPVRAMRVLPYAPGQEVEDVVGFHLRMRRRHQTHYAVTGRSLVYARLLESIDVPVLRSVPVVASIRSAMNEVVLRAVSARHSNLRFAAAVYRLLEDSGLYEAGVERVNTLRMFFDAPEFAETWVEPRGDQSVLVFAHKGLLEEITKSWTAVPLIEDVRSRLGVRMAVGFGVGESVRDSVRHAEMAVRRAIAEGGDTGYLMTEGGLVIGPMGTATGLSRYAYKTDDRTDGGGLRELSQAVGLGVSTLSRLADLERRLDGAGASAEEIGQALRVSVPSGRRILRVLRENGLASLAGLSQPSKRGRPKGLYRLDIGSRLSDTGQTI
ncbi:hypothetical protein [Rhizohabitans arisaemae]|uniref:hypothetical protein n=1 Tax=Rhizohabitans arisaemae TaxID=2720610 RepID=UPI0024B22DCD|nr:hypothetical protein [Rhizohabitans arisaemae]